MGAREELLLVQSALPGGLSASPLQGMRAISLLAALGEAQAPPWPIVPSQGVRLVLPSKLVTATERANRSARSAAVHPTVRTLRSVAERTSSCAASFSLYARSVLVQPQAWGLLSTWQVKGGTSSPNGLSPSNGLCTILARLCAASSSTILL